MQIIIVGCGKVGRTLAEQLQEEESDITLIDVSSNVITSLQDDIDAMGIVGNGASINTLVEAGIENADILIAVTGSDEMNLLCCLIACVINIAAGPTADADMFYISPFHPSSQPVFHEIACTAGIFWGNLLYVVSMIAGGFLMHKISSRLL